MKTREKAACASCGRDFGKLTLRGKEYYCPDHLRSPRMRDGTHKNWPLVTMNLGDDPNQGPIVVQNLRQLRQLENRYGVASEVYNRDSSNIAPYRGD